VVTSSPELRRRRHRRIRAVDIKPTTECYQVFDDVDSLSLDRRTSTPASERRAVAATSSTWLPTWAAWGSSNSTKQRHTYEWIRQQMTAPAERRRHLLV
jgi:hypothetical protein